MIGLRRCGKNCEVRFFSCSKAIYAVLNECFKERNVYEAYHTEKLKSLESSVKHII